MRATRHVPVTYQVLAHTKTPPPGASLPPARGPRQRLGAARLRQTRLTKLTMQTGRASSLTGLERTAHQNPSRPKLSPGEQRN